MNDIELRVKGDAGAPHAEVLRQQVAGALAAYYVAPTLRAVTRLGVGSQFSCWAGMGNNLKEEGGRNMEKGLLKSIFSSPSVHFALHGVCCALLIDIALGGNCLYIKRHQE